MPGYTWLNEELEHSEEDANRAEAIAAEITNIRSKDEQRMFRRQALEEEGCDYDPYEDCECEECIKADEGGCENCLVRKQHQKEAAIKQTRDDLHMEWLEHQLRTLGARMMRPYEHWNEDERVIEYMETRGDY